VRGLPLYLLLSSGMYAPGTSAAHIVVAKTSALRQGRDLTGKTIGINTVRDMLQGACMKFIQQDGGDPIAAKFYEIPSSEMAAGIESGRLDAAVLVEPNFTKFKDRVRSIGLPYTSVNDGKPFQVTGAICNKDWADKNPDLALRLTRALVRTAEWANKNPRAAVEILARVSKLDVETLESIPRSVFATKNNPQLIQPVIDLNFRYGFLPRTFPAAELYGGRPA
jgi:NitT/TauT family transport system substrate-binding protein